LGTADSLRKRRSPIWEGLKSSSEKWSLHTLLLASACSGVLMSKCSASSHCFSRAGLCTGNLWNV